MIGLVAFLCSVSCSFFFFVSFRLRGETSETDIVRGTRKKERKKGRKEGRKEGVICCDPFEDEDAGLGWILGCLVRWGASSVSRYCLFSCMVVCVCAAFRM